MASPSLLPCHGHDVVLVGKCHTDLQDSPTRDALEPDGSWFAGSVADGSAECLFDILVGNASPSHLISGPCTGWRGRVPVIRATCWPFWSASCGSSWCS